jgi:hypothetical protein
MQAQQWQVAGRRSAGQQATSVGDPVPRSAAFSRMVKMISESECAVTDCGVRS